jgi:VIT1/CCC1 family predicted Fe2+/Mn2+ transporter
VSAGPAPEEHPHHEHPHHEHPHHEHRDVTGGWLRPAVFGAMDGLVSNAALIAGVAGGGAAPRTVLLAGAAGLASGAFSMAAGEYTSVASQSELVRAELDVERRELVRHPDAERAELAAVYVARGVDPDLAERVAAQLSRDPEQALEVHAREELGVDPGDLPSPLLAAGSSFLAFGLGALVPLLPYLLGADDAWASVLAALAGLFLCGALVARVTARPWWWSGARQLLLGALAAVLSWLLGGAVGAGVG